MVDIINASPEVVENNLRLASSGLTSVSSYSGIELFNKYIEWVNTHVRMLAGQISQKDMDDLLQTRGYWSLRGADPSSLGNNLSQTVNREIEAQKHRIDVAADEIRISRQRWDGLGQMPVALILDTGVIEEFADRLLDVDWHQIADVRPHRYLYLVVPRIALDELDRHKQSRDNGAQSQVRRSNAKAAIKALWGMFGQKDLPSNFRRYDTTPVQQGQFELLNDEIEHRQLDDADAELLARSRSLAAYIPVKVLTFDTGMALRGMASGIDVVLTTAPSVDAEKAA